MITVMFYNLSLHDSKKTNSIVCEFMTYNYVTKMLQ